MLSFVDFAYHNMIKKVTEMLENLHFKQ